MSMARRQAAYLKSLRAGIKQHGWLVIGIADARPPFAYTVGLWGAYQHPEIILVGPYPPEQGKAILNIIGDRVKAGERLEVGRPYDGIIEHKLQMAQLQMVFLEVDQQILHEYFGAALAHYNCRFPALQAVWPDPQGRFPWEQGYQLASGARLPLLGPAPRRLH